jgi:hypothetical protein
MIPVIIEENRALSKGETQQVKIRCLNLVELETVVEDKSNVCPELIIIFIEVEVNFIQDCS